MSDEAIPPASLRLKPRVRPEAGDGAPSIPHKATPVSAATSTSVFTGDVQDDLPPSVLPAAKTFAAEIQSPTENEPKIKRFSLPAANSSAPKRLPVTIAPISVVEVETLAPPVEPSPAIKPPLVEPIVNDAVDVGRFKLKPRLTAPESVSPPPVVSLPTAVVAMPHLAAPLGIKIVATAPDMIAAAPEPAKPAPFVRRPQAQRPVRKFQPKPGKSRFFKFFLISVGLLAGGFIAVGGFLGFRYLTQMEKHSVLAPAHLPLPKKSVSSKVPVNIPSTDSDSDQASNSDPANAPDATSPNRQGELHATVPAVAGTTPTNVAAPAVVPQSVQPKQIPPPSAAFRALVVNLKVSGVFQGQPARALLNGRLLSSGEILDNQLGVRFIGIDAIHKLLIFDDSEGSVMQRRY